MEYALKGRQICLFIIAFFPVTKLLMMPSVVAGIAQEDIWISLLLNLLIDAITIFCLVLVFKNQRQNFFELLERYFGKIISKFIIFLYLLYFLLKAYLPINEQKDYVEQTLYITMPNVLTFMPFFLLAVYLCTQKLRVLGRCADILWGTTVVGIIILLALSLSNVNLESLLPVGANGIKNIAFGSYKSLTWFGDSVYFLFFVGNYKHKKYDTLKIMLSYLATAVLLLVFVILFYCTFTSIAFRQRFALTEISKYNTVINNLGRFDYIGILMILLSSAFSLILPLYFACKLLNMLFKLKNKYISPLIVCILHAILITAFNEYAFSLENFILNVGSGIFLVMGNIFPLIICLVKSIVDKRTLPIKKVKFLNKGELNE